MYLTAGPTGLTMGLTADGIGKLTKYVFTYTCVRWVTRGEGVATGHCKVEGIPSGAKPNQTNPK